MISQRKPGSARRRPEPALSRRGFFSSALAGAGLAAIADPGAAAAQAVGVKPRDLPDLTIKEAKIYQTDLSKTGFVPLNSPDKGLLASLTTAGGLEAVYTLGNRNATPQWLEWAKARLVGKNVMDLLPTIASTSGLKSRFGYAADPARSTFNQPVGAMLGDRPAFMTDALTGSGLTMTGVGEWPNWYTAAADVMMWDLLGQAVNRPIYKLLNGGMVTKTKMLCYASSTHLPFIEDFAPEVIQAKKLNFRGYKIHPGVGQHRDAKIQIPAYIGHMELIRQCRAAAGPEFMLAHDPVQVYNRFEAITVGRVLDELDYAWYEDPIQTTDIEGLIELNRSLDVPLSMGEFIYSISDYANYISRGALNIVRLIADNVGGISGSMRIGLLADAFGLECQPHNWGNPIDIMLHFHLELALLNAEWFELPMPVERADHPFMKTRFRPDADGFIHAPTAPGMGVEIDRAALDRMTVKMLR